MDTSIVRHKAELDELCRRFQVRRLEIFGSAATGALKDDSDLDFLIQFAPDIGLTYADVYFGLIEALESLFGRKVDLVVDKAIRNPYFRRSVDATKVLLYAA